MNQRSCAVNDIFWLFVGHSASSAGSLPLSVPVESLPRTAAPSGHNDRRCLHLQLTEKGHEFLREVLPPQHNCLHQLWSALSTTEKDQLEQITRKLLSRLDQMEQDGVVLEAMS